MQRFIFINLLLVLCFEKDINNSIRKKSTNRSKIYNDNISRIQPNDSFHSICVSQNANQDINTDKYIREDIDRSLIFRKLKDFNLIKVIDDINENYNTEATNHKFKFLIMAKYCVHTADYYNI